MAIVRIQLATEDDLSKAVVDNLLIESQPTYEEVLHYPGRGYGNLRRNIPSFNNASRGMPWLVLTDLDQTDCPPIKIADWMQGHEKHPNLLLRIAVREVEAWVMADREAFARFLGIRRELVPADVEAIRDPKQTLCQLASRSRRRHIREGICPASGTTARVGPDYNGQLVPFVRATWDPRVAAPRSPSLARTLSKLDTFQPA